MPTPTREFKIGIIGCGRISQTYVQALHGLEGVRLTAVADTRAEAANSTAEAEGCRAYTDLAAFIRDSGVEGAVICAPPAVHKDAACALMQEGIHVLCEKPFATRTPEARAMLRTATAHDVVLMMASKFRYVEDIIRAKAIVTSGLLGEVLFYENRFCAKVNMRGRWNADPEMAGGGVLMDNGTHSVDIVRYLLGPIRRVYAQEGKRVMGLPVEDTASVSFSTERDVSGTIYLSWSINMPQQSYINIYGTDGALSVGWTESKYQHNGHADWIPFGVGYNKIDAFKNQLQNFVETVRGSAQPVITMEDGLASVEVVETAYRAMNIRNWLEVEEESSQPKVAAAS